MFTSRTRAAYIRTLFSILHLSICVLLLLLATSSPAPAEQKSPTKACKIPEADATGLNVDDGTDVHAVVAYEDAVVRLLQKRKFKELDCVANSARSSQEQFAGGMWKLHIFYDGLQAPRQHATEKDWHARLGQLTQWVSANPNSITARVALAEAYISYGLDARGDGYADTVSKSGWELFEKRIAKSRRILKEASALHTQCPEWYVAMQEVALFQGWSIVEARALFERAAKFAPTYQYAYRVYALFILPKFYGEEGDSEKFAEEVADRLGGEQGDILYFQIAGILCHHNNDGWAKPVTLMSWTRIQRGFNALERQRGKSYTNLNLLALMATLKEDSVLADNMFTRIGNQWDESTWRSEPYFESCKESAKESAPFQAEVRAREDAAEANLRTAEGARYQAAFEARIKELMKPCNQATEGDPIKVEWLIRVAKDGKIENMLGIGVTNASNCLAKQLAEFRLNDKAVFPPPPQPSYWMRVDLDPVTSASAAKN
jgi:hypothetical protein